MLDEHDSNDDLIMQGMDDLLRHIDIKFDQNTFSNKFKDPKLEREFQIKFLVDFRSLAQFTLAQNVLLAIALLLYVIWRLITTKGEYFKDMRILTMVAFAIGMVSQYIQYVMAKKYLRVALTFSCIQTMVFVVLFFEHNFLVTPEHVDATLFPVIMIYVQSLSIIGYDMAIQSCLYIALSIY